MRAGIIVAAINAVIISAYVWFEPVIPFAPEYFPRRLVIVAIVIAIVALTVFSSVARNLQASVFAALLTLAALEATFQIAPSAFPDNVRLFVETHQPQAREAIVERLPYSPFVKPKADVHVIIPGYYGPKHSFEYEWRSDKRGFKNLPEVAGRDQFDIVAVGDSYTEGMGVKVQDTWASLLSRGGIATYNLGIQGYSPTQFLGAYEHFGKHLRHKWVVIGLLGGVYRREAQYRTADKFPAQAIDRLAEQDDVNKQRPIYLETREGYRVPIIIRRRHRFLTSAVVSLAVQQATFIFTFNIAGGIGNPEADIRFTRSQGLDRYRTEALGARASLDEASLLESEEWRSTERAIEQIAEIAHSGGARTLLVFFPNRGTAFHKLVTGSELPDMAADLVQARAAREFARNHSIYFLDVTPVFVQASAGLSDANLKAESPYLEIDGHPSQRGHEIIAKEIAARIR